MNSDSLTTVKSTAVFNMFKHLAHILSEKYHLADEKFDQVISNRLFIIVRVIREIQTATLLPFIVLYQIDIDRLWLIPELSEQWLFASLPPAHKQFINILHCAPHETFYHTFTTRITDPDNFTVFDLFNQEIITNTHIIN